MWQRGINFDSNLCSLRLRCKYLGFYLRMRGTGDSTSSRRSASGITWLPLERSRKKPFLVRVCLWFKYYHWNRVIQRVLSLALKGFFMLLPCLILTWFSICSHSSLRLSSQMSKLRQVTRQMMVYLNTLSYGFITFYRRFKNTFCIKSFSWGVSLVATNKSLYFQSTNN